MKKRFPAGIAALVLCLLIPFTAIGELQSRNIEENGKITETVWEDDNGRPAEGPEGYCSVHYTYKKENTYETYYDADGQPCRSNGGYYGRRVMKDGSGNITEIEYLDRNGSRVLNRQGYGLVTMTYYRFGDLQLVTYYGLDKRKPVIVPSLGYASVLYEYSAKTLTARTFRDEKKNPVDSADGYAILRQKTDKLYRVISIRYDHADGSPATGPDGWFRCTKDRDGKGRITCIKYYDVNTQLTDRGAGYAWEEYAWEGDSVVKVTRFSLDGKPIADDSGVVTTVREMKDDLIVKESFLDGDGNRTLNSAGVGAVLYGYDLQGSLETVTYQDTEGNAVRCLSGYAGYRDTKDDDGATVARTYLGTDGMPVEIPGGYSEIRYSYDSTKTLTSTQYYDLNGKQVRSE